MDISLNATLQYDCPVAHAAQSNWKVFSVPSLRHQPDWTKPLVVPGFQLGNDPTVMHIPKKTLSLGVYVFNFSVILVPSWPQAAVDKGSDSIYVSILSDLLQAVLLGEVNKTIKFTDQLVLDGSTSMDPDVDDPLEGVQFSWFCTTNSKNYNGDKINVISKEVCLPKQVDLKLTWASDPVLTISPETLRGGHVYFFRMVIQKAPRSAYSDKRVHVLQAPAPKASISCIENCGRILVLSDRFSLSLNCPDCARSREVYKWSILRASGDEVAFDWLGQTSTGRDSDSLSIKAFAFRNFSEAQFWIALDLETWGGVNLNLRHSFTVNYAPAIGDCKINPTSGIAFFTKFVVQCNNFKDQNIPLTYKMIVSDLYDGFGEISSLTENTLGPILYVGNDPKCPPSFLPVGGGDSHYSLKVLVQVYDALKAFSQVTFYATVQAPTAQASPQAILTQLVNFTSGQNSEISTLLQKQEFLFAGYLVYVVASVLNSMKPEPALQADKAWLQEHLVNQSSLLPMNTLMEINQVVTVFAKLTQRTSEFPQLARQSATERIWQANQAFQQHQQKGKNLHSEQIETMSTGILTSVSNILKMTDPHIIFVDPFRLIQSLADTILAGKVPDYESTVMSSASFTMYASKLEKGAVSNNILGNKRHCRNCFQPALNVSSIPRLSANAPVSVVFCEFADDPFPWLNYQDSLAADVVGFRLTGIAANGDKLELTPDVVDVYISRRNLSSAAFNLTVGPDHEPDNADASSRMTTGAFRFEVDSRAVRELLVHIVTEVTVQFTVLVYAGGQITPSALVATFLVPHGIPPIANQSGLFDPACAVSVPRLVCLPLSLLQVIAQRGHSPECVIIMVLKAPHFVMQPSDKLVRISLFSVHCLDMYGVQSDWTEDTCVLGEKTTWDRVHCVCRKARRARRQLANIPLHFRYLTAKVIVPPNPVDLRLEVIKNVTQNPVTLFVVLFILVTYIVLAFWALHRDETDQYLRDHAMVLPDNDPYDNICYLVTVFTGSRCGSGTRANVFVQLTGTQNTSDVHCLSHPHFKTLYRGSVHTFLLTTSRDLGDIQSIRVWHNNEGHAPGWYLSRIKVENLFSRHIWLFMCREWLSIETSLDRTFPVTDPNTPLQRMDFLLIDATDNLGKNHLWFSVFAGVISRGFNRLQRLSCCLAMLLSTLLCNIMFFNLDTEKQDKQDQGNRYVRSMIIGLESVMITLPVQVIITGLFTYSQRRPQVTLDQVTPQEYPEVAEASGHWEERLERWHAQETAAEARSQEARSQEVHAEEARAQEMAAEARSQEADAQEARAQEMAAEARFQEADTQEMAAEARSEEASSKEASSEEADAQEADAQEMDAEAHSQEAHSEEASSEEAHAQEAGSQEARAQEARSQRARSQKARSQRARSQKARAQETATEARSQKSRSQKSRSQKSRSQKSRSQKSRSQKSRSQKSRSQKSRSQKSRSQKSRSPQETATEARSQKSRSQKSRSQKSRSQKARSQKARSQEARAQETAAEARSQEPRAQEARSQKASARKAQQSLTRKLTGRHKSLSKRTSKAGHSLRKKDSKGPHPPGTNTNANANNENMNNSSQVPSAQPPPPPQDQEPRDPFVPLSPPTKPRTTLSGWWKWIAWFLVFATSGVSSFFIVFYGLTYGYEKSIEWLFASLSSFFESVFLVQPSKIILFTGMRTNRLKYCKNLSWVSNFRYTEIQLQDLRLRPEEMHQRHQDLTRLRGSSMYQPLTQDEVGIFRRKRALKRRALLFLGHFLTHCIFLALLLGLVALLRRTDSFRYNQFIRSRFSVDLATVTKLDDIYPWLHSTLLPLFHNDLHPTFLPHSSSSILGLPLLRQVRATPGPKACRPAKRFPPNSIKGEIRCHPEYGADPEDTSDHPSFWKKVAKREADKNTNGFTYKPPEERWVYYSYGLLHTYGSGGYVFYFFPDQQQFNSTLRLRDLQSGRWLDEKTWAVILELTTLNADAGLLGSTSILFEVSQLGVVNASISVHSFSLADLNRDTSAEVYLYVAILVFFVAYVVYEGYVITQKGASYLANANNLFNLALKCTLAVLIVLFLRKYFLATGIIQFYSSNPVDFIPFHAVAQVDRTLGVVLGLLLFLTILKTLRYFRFFYHVRLAERVLQTALPGICHVALLVFVYFFLFVAFGHLVFGQHEWGYSTLIRATQTVFSYCTAALRNAEFSSNRALGVLLLAAFVLLLICVLIHLFTAVILSAYKALRQPVYEEPSGEAEAIAYLCGKLRTVFGFLCCQPKAQEQRELFVDMLYGKPERHSSHYLGLKTRNINEKKMVYLVV
ncbi:Polycystic kidney disease and receptor for egg jelly-related protein [Myotis brandtii]|uniref:Polycystic kidney disease and receptor for egg jelly-related protein n=2 Tax=Myotis brandtii TaxID=109478 RepID=S7QFM9_MYOBR|nr:Polycystic kidney disease and receptor for egg jelly-related protein [Myotis brandtii]